jgi:hypothetical protein
MLWDGEGLRKVTHLFLMILVGPLNVVTFIVAVHKIVSETLNKDLLNYIYKPHFILSSIENISNSFRVHLF